jgi:DNA-binding transcriptional MerR regulator
MMAVEPTSTSIPNRAVFKATEVCELAKLQPYVLRSWEVEFPELGVAKTDGGARVYRRADVERVLRIKHLLLVEGLTLAGARRKMSEEATPVAADAPVIDELLGRHARERLTEVKRGLQGLLELLDDQTQVADFQFGSPASATPASRSRASHPSVPTGRLARNASPERTVRARSVGQARASAPSKGVAKGAARGRRKR